jgi:hypothetical protein
MSPAPAARLARISSLLQPTWFARTRPQTRLTTPAETEGDAGQVEPHEVAAAFRQQPHREKDADHAERDVDPEDPMPVDALCERTTDQRSAGDGEAGEPSRHADDETAPLVREGGGEDRQAERHHGRAAQSLHRPRRNQERRVRSQRARRRGEGEKGEPEHEDAAATEAVAVRRGGDDPGREGDPVGVHGPLQRRQSDAQVLLHPRQRGDHDQAVQHDHEEGQ